MNMVAPFTAAVSAIATAIAGLTTWWGEATTKAKLMLNNPNIDAGTVLAAFNEATFTGHTALMTSAVPAVFTDPTTGLLMIRLAPPAGGWKWSPSDTVNLPQTIFGVYLTDTGGTKLLGAAKFSTPIILTEVGQLIDLGTVVLPVNPVPLGP